jgi:SAM-dependent methyltransferase
LSEPLPDWAPEGIDLTTPSAARLYDYYLGGAHNFGVDRELAQKVLAVVPDLPIIAQANRAFLHRAVRYLIDQGVRQFIDIGSGIPTEGNAHETAQRYAPDSTILYVDHDPVAVVHSEHLLKDTPNAQVLQADLRRPQDILASAELSDLIDLSQPVGLLMVAVLHFVTEDERPEKLIGQFHDALVPGSYLAISQVASDSRPAEGQAVSQLYESAADPLVRRSLPRIRELFDGWDLVDPGLVRVPEWRPDWPDDVGPETSSNPIIAAVGRKP